LIGGLTEFAVHYGFATGDICISKIIWAYRGCRRVQNNPTNAALLEVAKFTTMKTETVGSARNWLQRN